MVDDKPCCAAAAARKIKKIMIRDQETGIAQLDEIIAKIRAMNLDDAEIGRALLKEVKIFNFVPRSQEKDYELAMVKEYDRRKNDGG
ncbi:MAG: hypothetical protein SA339_14080 [Methanomassiliicoccus sp.]|nr:hypothetical protein [Methanomassiliicoccus sp.]